MPAGSSSPVDATTHDAPSSAAFDCLVAQLGTGVLQTSLDGRLIRLNEACAHLLGFESPEAAKAAITEAGWQIHADPKRRIELIARLLAEGRIDGAVARLRRRDGSVFWASQAMRLAVDPSSGERCILATITDVTVVVDQRHALAAVERDYRSMFENASLGVYRSTPDGRLLRVNPALCRMLGVADEREMLVSAEDAGDGWYVQPGRRAEFMARMARDGRVVGFESEIFRGATRDTLWVRETAWTIRDADGRTMFHEGVVEDITAERAAAELRRVQDRISARMQEVLARSAERLRSFADIASDWYWESDPSGRITFVSEGISRIGVEPRMAIGGTRPDFPAAVDESSPGYREMRTAMARRRRYKDLTYAIRRPDGRSFMIASSGEPQFDIDGNYLGYRGISRDVTEQVAARDALALSEARFRDFAEVTADWFWEQDAELRVTYVSPSRQAMTGIPDMERLGLPGTDMRRSEDDAERWRAHLEAVERREPFKDFRYERIDALGRRRHLAISGRPVFDAGGAFVGYRGVGKDETELVEAQRALEVALAAARAATEQEQRFATTVAHEFRTSLTIIDGAAQRLLRQLGDPNPDDMGTRIAKIRGAVRSMETLIDTMLDSARLASGRLRMERQRVDLVAFVAAQIRGFDPAATGHEIVLRHSPADAPVSADPRMLEHIVSNLLSNAIKYSGASRRVDVAVGVDAAAATASLSVRDYGIGIPADELPQLFQRFFRASTARSIPGTGIGLALVHDLVQRHDGRIAVESEPGRGSCFTVTLPLLDGAPAG